MVKKAVAEIDISASGKIGIYPIGDGCKNLPDGTKLYVRTQESPSLEYDEEMVEKAAFAMERRSNPQWTDAQFDIWWNKDSLFVKQINNWPSFSGTRKQKVFEEARTALAAVGNIKKFKNVTPESVTNKITDVERCMLDCLPILIEGLKNLPGGAEVLAKWDNARDVIRPCDWCDGTGDVHRADGEWLGECPCKEEDNIPEECPECYDTGYTSGYRINGMCGTCYDYDKEENE